VALDELEVKWRFLEMEPQSKERYAEKIEELYT
jgi:hypothetical protein